MNDIHTNCGITPEHKRSATLDQQPTPAPSGPAQSESLPVGRISDEEVKRATPQCWTKNHAREDGTFDEDKYAAGYNACVEPTPTPPQPAPEPAEGYWECQRCGEQVPPSHVTYAEHHDGQCGGACEWVDVKPDMGIPTSPAPDRHEASRAAFEAHYPFHDCVMKRGLWEAWCRALDHAAQEQPKDKGQISDGYHTFDELYEHRCSLFLALMASNPAISWASTLHDDGSSFDGWFIAGMNLPTGAVTYHLPAGMWSLACETKATILERAPKWDGHTAADVVKRLQAWVSEAEPTQGSAEDWTAERWHDIITKDPCKATSVARHLSIECSELKEDVANLRTQLTAEHGDVEKMREALEAAEQYLVERGVEVRGTVGRTKILPMIREALGKTE